MVAYLLVFSGLSYSLESRVWVERLAFWSTSELGGNQEWLNKLWSSITGGGAPLAVDYYGDAIRLQVLLVVSGNWWLPTKAVGEERTGK